MKRPLFWVCAFLSLLAVIRLYAGGGGTEVREQSGAPPEEGLRVTFCGRVCGKEFQGDEAYLILTDLSSFQDAEVSRQYISILNHKKTDRIQCFLEAGSWESMPKIGSEVIAEGSFSFFPSATNPGEFDLEKHYRGRQIGGRLKEAHILKESERHDPVREFLACLRAYFGRRLDRVFPKREAGVLRTMLLGDRSELDPDVKDLYQRGGILHVLSISGLHVTLLGMGLFELLRKIGMRGGIAAAFAGVILILYGMMTGMGVSACRAIGMFLLRMLAYLAGRTYDLVTATGVMACAMLCLIPVYGMNSGFWLSFGSILGVGVILPVLERAADSGKGEKKVKKWHEKLMRTITDGFRAGGSVLLATLPLTLLFYYEVPTYSMLINLLVIPAMSPVLFFGIVAMVIPGLGILGTVSACLLRAFEVLCALVSGLPFSTWNPGCPKIWQVIAYYALLGAAMMTLWTWRERTPERGGNEIGCRPAIGARLKRRTCWVLPVILLVMAGVVLAIPARRMTGVTFLDVGQGDCVVLRLENGQTWICDCGNGSGRDVGENVLIPYLKHEGIHRIDGVFATHGDKDHVSGLVTLFERSKAEKIRIDALYLPERKKGCEEFMQLTKAAEAAGGCRIHLLKAGDALQGDLISIAVLHPIRGSEAEGNEGSLCLWVRLRKGRDSVTILLTGDVEGDGETELLRELAAHRIFAVRILKCAHHGSRNATSEEFLKRMDAETAVISCGRHNSYGHPHAETLERLLKDGSRILRTDQTGAVILRLENGKLIQKPAIQ